MSNFILALIFGGLTGVGPPEEPEAEPPAGTAGAPASATCPSLTMSAAVVCLTVDGYRDYVERADSVLTKDEKLMLYFEPSGHEYELQDGVYRLHLTEDVQLRRRGQEKVLWEERGIVEYEATSETPPLRLYLMNEIALKRLSPGAYDLTIRLHDQLGDGPPAIQVVKFIVRSTADRPPGPAVPS